MALAFIVKHSEELEVKLPQIDNKACFSVVELPAQIE